MRQLYELLGHDRRVALTDYPSPRRRRDNRTRRPKDNPSACPADFFIWVSEWEKFFPLGYLKLLDELVQNLWHVFSPLSRDRPFLPLGNLRKPPPREQPSDRRYDDFFFPPPSDHFRPSYRRDPYERMFRMVLTVPLVRVRVGVSRKRGQPV